MNTSDKPRVRMQDGAMVPVQMNDSLTNLVAGIGTQRDKRSHNTFGFGNFAHNWVELELAYLNNWISRQIVDVPVEDGLREWRSYTIDDTEEIVQEEKRLAVRSKYKLARYWSRLFGGSIILMITDQDVEQPLNLNKITKGSLKRLVVMDRWDINPVNINYHNPMSEDYLLPEYYRVTNGQTQIHSSHVIRCDGEDISRRARTTNMGWGDSTLRRVMEDVKDVTATKGGIASLVLEANVDTVKREGLSQELASGQEEVLLQRYALAGQLKSFVNMLLLDGTETYERKSLTFAGLGQILNQFMVWISGAADIPMTRLFGRSAAGMNATGEGDMDNYYNKISSMQESQFRPDLEKLDQVLVRSALGNMPEEFDFEWNPLYQESGLELAQQELAIANAEDMRIAQGVLKKSQVMVRMKQEGKYAISEDDIKEMQKLEEEEKLIEEEQDLLEEEEPENNDLEDNGEDNDTD